MDIGKMVPSIEMYIYTLCESDYLNEWGGGGTLLDHCLIWLQYHL